MRLLLNLTCGLALLLAILLVAPPTDAARFSYRSRIRVRYSTSRYTYVGPLYSRRLSPSLMGPLYFAYASRYPLYYNYRRSYGTAGAPSSGETCTNNLALSNGSYVGSFSCPFLPDEPANWTSCCGYDTEEFCCDPDYDDSWKLAVGLSAVAIVAIVGGCLVVFGVALFLVIRCCVMKPSSGGSGGSGSSANSSSSAMLGTSSAAANKPEVGVLNPVKPPYPTMEYGTVQPPAAGQPGSAPYPPMPPYPPPYSSQ